MSYKEYRWASFAIKLVEIISVGSLIAGITKIRDDEEAERAKEKEFAYKNLTLTLFTRFSEIINLRFDVSSTKQKSLELLVERISLQLEHIGMKEDIKLLSEINQDLKEESEELKNIQHNLEMKEKKLKQDFKNA